MSMRKITNFEDQVSGGIGRNLYKDQFSEASSKELYIAPPTPSQRRLTAQEYLLYRRDLEQQYFEEVARLDQEREREQARRRAMYHPQLRAEIPEPIPGIPGGAPRFFQ